MSHTSDRPQPHQNPSEWELPPLGNEVVKPSFSLLRVIRSVAIAMVVVTPSLYSLGYYGYLSDEEKHTCSAHGSGTRTNAPFDLKNATVPRSEIRSGGPPKDGIPAISEPQMISVSEADHLEPADRVIGVLLNEQARAYPIAILNYHEVINDKLGDQPYAISYCPLCDSVSAFDRNTADGEREFGVSGLLYNSNVLMFDRDESSESLWSQLKSESIAGRQVGKQLQLLPVELTTWAEWKTRYPTTQVMSNHTGHKRDYTRSPYASYFETDELMFPVDQTDDRLPAKEKVLGVLVDGVTRAYPASAFLDGATTINDVINGKQLLVEFNPATNSMRIANADEGVTWMYSLWFSWFAMHPETEIYAGE